MECVFWEPEYNLVILWRKTFEYFTENGIERLEFSAAVKISDEASSKAALPQIPILQSKRAS